MPQFNSFPLLAHLIWNLIWTAVHHPFVSVCSSMCKFFTFSSSSTITKHGRKHLWVKEIPVISHEGSRLFKEDLLCNSENTQKKFTNFLLKNYCANFNQTWHNTSLGKWNLRVFFKKRGIRLISKGKKITK